MFHTNICSFKVCDRLKADGGTQLRNECVDLLCLEEIAAVRAVHSVN